MLIAFGCYWLFLEAFICIGCLWFLLIVLDCVGCLRLVWLCLIVVGYLRLSLGVSVCSWLSLVVCVAVFVSFWLLWLIFYSLVDFGSSGRVWLLCLWMIDLHCYDRVWLLAIAFVDFVCCWLLRVAFDCVGFRLFAFDLLCLIVLVYFEYVYFFKLVWLFYGFDDCGWLNMIAFDWFDCLRFYSNVFWLFWKFFRLFFFCFFDALIVIGFVLVVLIVFASFWLSLLDLVGFAFLLIVRNCVVLLFIDLVCFTFCCCWCILFRCISCFRCVCGWVDLLVVFILFDYVLSFRLLLNACDCLWLLVIACD